MTHRLADRFVFVVAGVLLALFMGLPAFTQPGGAGIVNPPTNIGALSVDTLTVDTSLSLPAASIADAALSSNVPLLDTNQTITGAWNFAGGLAQIQMRETDASADSGLWSLRADFELLRLGLRTDADAFGATALEIGRTGTNVDHINLTGDAVQANGATIATYSGSVAASNTTITGLVGHQTVQVTSDVDITLSTTEPGAVVYLAGSAFDVFADTGNSVTVEGHSIVDGAVFNISSGSTKINCANSPHSVIAFAVRTDHWHVRTTCPVDPV